MTDEAKALVEDLMCVDRAGVLHSRRPKHTHPVCHKAADRIETQAAEIERLREECQAQYDRGYYDGRAALGESHD